VSLATSEPATTTLSSAKSHALVSSFQAPASKPLIIYSGMITCALHVSDLSLRRGALASILKFATFTMFVVL
jgi:hypothetical protein